MNEITRFGVSIPSGLLSEFDTQIEQRGYSNRSKALADLVRAALKEQRVVSDQEVVGLIHLVYDHHTRELTEKLTALQHHHTGKIISSMHVHLDHHDCLEVVVLSARASEIQSLSDQMAAIRGVKQAGCVICATASHED